MKESRRLVAAAICTSPWWFAFPLIAFANQTLPDPRTSIHRHLTKDDQIRDILGHPAFAATAGFAESILPTARGTYAEDLLLRDVRALLPYHSHVNPEEIVAGVNRLVDDASGGKKVFHDIYTPQEKQQEPGKIHTGLFFLRGTRGAPFALIAAGGGSVYVASLHEGFPYAQAINRKGYNAFVLRYRVGQGGGVGVEDVAAALTYIFRNAAALGVETQGYSVWGSSAGARLVASIGTHGVARFGGDPLPKPAMVVTAYTAHSDYSTEDPPTFAVVGEHDGISPPIAMERRVAALKAAGVAVEYRKYPSVGHGFGLGTGTSAEGWVDEAIRFWEARIQRAKK